MSLVFPSHPIQPRPSDQTFVVVLGIAAFSVAAFILSLINFSSEHKAPEPKPPIVGPIEPIHPEPAPKPKPIYVTCPFCGRGLQVVPNGTGHKVGAIGDTK